MKKFLQALLLVGVGVTGYSQLAQAEAPAPELRPGPYFYAFEECKFGCMLMESNPSNAVIFSGAVPKTYRVCVYQPTGYVPEASVRVDDRSVSTRGCMDVNGRSITLTGGKAKVGRVPE